MELVMIAVVIGSIILTLVLYYSGYSSFSKGKIEITRVQLSDDGNLVDINYLIRKPGRVTSEPDKIYLLDELRVKKIKAPASGLDNVIDINARRRSTGNIQLPNNHKVIKKGSLVTVSIGDCRREHLIVV